MGTIVKTPKVDLIPWDPNSEEHVKRMFDQRVACGWRSDEVQSWIEHSNQGTMNLYWLVLSPSLPNRNDLLAQHIARFPKESPPLSDTSPTTFTLPRHPSNLPIHPTGHIALSFPPATELTPLCLPTKNVAYISKLYVSWAVQSSGLGGTAVRAIESLARDELDVKVVYLDAVAAQYQMREDMMGVFYGVMGIPYPKISNEAWYVKLGYEEFLRKKEGYYFTYPPDESGKAVAAWIPVVYFKKTLC